MRGEVARIPLWLDLAAVAFGHTQGGAFGTLALDERSFDPLAVAGFATSTAATPEWEQSAPARD